MPQNVLCVATAYPERIDASALKGIRAFTDAYGRESLQAAYVACRTSLDYPLGDDISAISGSRIADKVVIMD